LSIIARMPTDGDANLFWVGEALAAPFPSTVLVDYTNQENRDLGRQSSEKRLTKEMRLESAQQSAAN
jgi:hypothetical protein